MSWARTRQKSSSSGLSPACSDTPKDYHQTLVSWLSRLLQTLVKGWSDFIVTMFTYCLHGFDGCQKKPIRAQNWLTFDEYEGYGLWHRRADLGIATRYEHTSPKSPVSISAENAGKAIGHDFRSSKQSESGNEHSPARHFHNVAWPIDASRYRREKPH